MFKTALFAWHWSETRPPPSVLSVEEAAKLVEWAVHMSDIGYGRTKEQLKDYYCQTDN